MPRVADATKARADLETMQGARTQRTEREHESPLERYRRDINNTQKNMDDELQNVAIDAMDRLADSTANAASEYLKLGGIAGDVINGIIRLAVQQTIVKALVGGASKLSGATRPRPPRFCQATTPSISATMTRSCMAASATPPLARTSHMAAFTASARSGRRRSCFPVAPR